MTTTRLLSYLAVVTFTNCQGLPSPDEKAKDTVIRYLNSADFEGPIVTFEAVRWGPFRPWRRQDANRTEAAQLRKEAARLSKSRITGQHTAQVITLAQLQATQAQAASSRIKEKRLRRTADSLEQVLDTTQVAQAIFIVYSMPPATHPLDSAWFTVWPNGLVLVADVPSQQPAAGQLGR